MTDYIKIADRPTLTEEVREALMRLTMCAMEECEMCKYKNECGFDFQYEISIDNMHTILNAFNSADRPTDWTPLRFEDEYKMTSDFPWELDGSWVIVTDGQRVSVERIKKDAYDHFFPNGRYFELEDTIAWMPLPKIINNITESPNDVDETDDEVIEPSDIISRADAKKEVYLLGKNPSINEIWDCLDALPSADAVQGEWIMHGEPPWYVRECSKCGTKWHQWSGDSNPNFCGHCGAKMKGGDDE